MLQLHQIFDWKGAKAFEQDLSFWWISRPVQMMNQKIEIIPIPIRPHRNPSQVSFSEQEAQDYNRNNHKACKTIPQAPGTARWTWRNCWPFRPSRRRRRGDPNVPTVPLRQDHHDQLLSLLAVALGPTDEVVRTGPFKLHRVVPTLVLFEWARGVAAEVAFPCHLQHRIFLSVVLPHWKPREGRNSESGSICK